MVIYIRVIDILDRCDPDPCDNGGTCTTTEDWYKCECQPGYGGERCKIRRKTIQLLEVLEIDCSHNCPF